MLRHQLIIIIISASKMIYLLEYYASAFNNTKSDHTLPIRYNFARCVVLDAVLRHAEDMRSRGLVREDANDREKRRGLSWGLQG